MKRIKEYLAQLGAEPEMAIAIGYAVMLVLYFAAATVSAWMIRGME